VPFVREFWWGTYGLGIISPQKKQISVITAVDITAYDVTRSVTYLLRHDETKAGSSDDVRSKQCCQVVC